MTGPALRITALSARHGDGDDAVRAVDGVDLAVERGEFVSILGPSGCGKTTLLRVVAGLHRPSAGTVEVDGAPVFGQNVDVPAERRGVGMVFQSLALWPHLTVAETASFPLDVIRRRDRPTPAVRRERVRSVLDMVGLGALADRPSTALSGGQRQRLALARALITEPSVLLLDEPFSDLDAPLREATRLEVKLTQQRAGVSVVLVTHDQDEALSMSDRVAVMREGRFLQVGSPADVYRRPVDERVAGFVGRSARLSARLSSPDAVETAHGTVVRRPGPSLDDIAVGDEVCVVLRPEDVLLVDEGHPGAWAGVVEAVQFRGEVLHVVVRVGDDDLIVQTRSDARSDAISPGDPVHVAVCLEGAVVTARSPHRLEGEQLS